MERLGHEPDNRPDIVVSSPNQVLMLSLFLKLLVFFILMNTISIFTPKAKDVMKSMRDTMGGTTKMEMVQGSSFFVNSGRRQGEGTSLDDVVGLFEHGVPGLAPTRIRGAGVLELSMGASKFNALLGANVPGRGVDPVFQNLIHYVKTHEKPRYKMIFTAHIRPDLIKSQPQSYDDRFLSFWAARLSHMGLSSDQLEVGVTPGHPGIVTFQIVPIAEDQTDGQEGGMDVENS